MAINRVSLSGNLTRDPELRAAQGGTAILRLGIAVNDRRKNQQTGEWEDYPNFVDCVMFGTRAEKLGAYLCKGTKVAVEGKLRYSSWETDEGQKRSKLEVVVDEIEFMSQRQDGAQTAQNQSYAPQSAYHSQVAAAPQSAPQNAAQAAAMVRQAFPGARVVPGASDLYDE